MYQLQDQVVCAVVNHVADPAAITVGLDRFLALNPVRSACCLPLRQVNSIYVGLGRFGEKLPHQLPHYSLGRPFRG